jgi:hypothetical protein
VPRFQRCRFIVYEDALYRRIDGLREAALDRLGRTSHELHPCTFASAVDAHARKRAAVCCYRSQLRALATEGRSGHADAFSTERYWAIVPTPPLR